MEHSEEIKAIATQLAHAQEKFPEIPKTKTATVKTKSGAYQYNYADLPDIIKATRPVLFEHGLVISQTVGTIWQGDSNPVIDVTTILIHTETGEYIKDTGQLLIPRLDPQSVGSAITYARRYGYCAIIGIAAEEDDDAGAATYTDEDVERGAKQAMQQSKPKPAVVAQPKTQTANNPGQFLITFGKHSGNTLEDIPISYLEWALENLSKKPDVVEAIQLYFDWLADNATELDLGELEE